MQKLSKIVVLLIVCAIFFLFQPTSIKSQVPELLLSCSETSDDEFHSLRPYQAAPCGGAPPPALFCSNKLVIFETFDLAYKCQSYREFETGTRICELSHQVEAHNLNITLDESEFPIIGNTQDDFDDAQKVNEYASWYLNGVIDKRENENPTDNQIVNLSGPVRKLLPSMIQDAQRIEIMRSYLTESTYKDEENGENIEVTEPENHDQLVVEDLRLSGWAEGDLSFIRDLATKADNTIIGGLLGGAITGTLNTAGIDISPDAWNKRYPPLPWDDGTVELPSEENPAKPFEDELLYKKAYNEWLGKSCLILPLLGLQCVDIKIGPLDFITNKYAELWHFVPLSNNSDKKGKNYLLTGDGPSYVPSQGTEIDNAQHKSYRNAPLYFAHTQEVYDLSQLLNQTYRPDGYESEKLPETTEKIKKGVSTKTNDNLDRSNLTGDKNNNTLSTRDPYSTLDCSAVNVRVNEGDDLFPGDRLDKRELYVEGVEYEITEVECDEVYEKGPETICEDPLDKGPCYEYIEDSFICTAQVGIEFKTGTQTPYVNEIFADTVADSGSTFRKIFPKVEEGAPVECIADIPTTTNVTYSIENDLHESPAGGVQEFKETVYPADGSNSGTQLTFPHVGSVYEYFLKGIQTALRPKGYGEPIANGNCKPTELEEEVKCDEDVPDSAVNEKYLGSFKDNFIDLANRWSEKCPGEENNMAKQCYNFVASEAQKAGVNPAFALTIWLNESGASNYCEGGPTTQDMGMNVPAIYQDLAAQVDRFMDFAKVKWCDGMSGYVEPMHGWLSRFQSSAGICNPSDAIATQYYYDVMNFTWNAVSGCNNGKFGITWPTDMSCP